MKRSYFKRLLASALALVMLLGMLPGSVLADPAEEPELGLILTLQNQGSHKQDRRVRLNDFNVEPEDENTPQNGSYEIQFKVLKLQALTGIAFLARYKDEGHYVGVTVESGVWKAHYTYGNSPENTTQRDNTALAVNQNITFVENGEYKVKLSFEGTQVTIQAADITQDKDAAY